MFSLNSLWRDSTTVLQSLSLTTNAKFNSEEPWAIIITLELDFCAARNTLDAIPTVPLIPEPMTAIIATFGTVSIFFRVVPSRSISNTFSAL